MELFKAHQQWSTRPADERFTSIQGLYDATKQYADASRERPSVPVASLRLEAQDKDVVLTGKGNVGATLTHWAFGQLAARCQAPASYLRSLPATLACQNLNHGLANRLQADQSATVNLLFHLNGGFVVRALTSDRYERVWNHEIAARLLGLESSGWAPAKPDIRVIDDRLPLYASDHDMFAFVNHPSRTIDEPGNPGGLRRGLIVENSEVGASKLRMTRFLYREMCGNHIIWGAKNVSEIALRHVGSIRHRLSSWDLEIRRYMDQGAAADEAMIAAARTRRIAATKDEVLDLLFGKKMPGLTRAALESGYAAVVEDQDGDPRSVWGIVQGLTRHSQTLPYADARTDLDRAAGQLLTAF